LKEHAPKVPVIPGYNGDDQSLETLTKAALGIGMGQGKAEQSRAEQSKAKHIRQSWVIRS